MMRPFDLALRYVGVREVPGVMDNPLILTMLKLDGDWPQHDEVPWCSGFVNFICWQLRRPRSKSLAARSWLKVGQAIDLKDAYPGEDIVVFWRGKKSGPYGHVGFFAGQEGDLVWVLGGNQKDEVNLSAYPVRKLLGVRRLG